MFFMIGVMPGRKEFEYNRLMTCPACGAYGRYVVYMTYTVLSLFFIPVFKWGKRYYAETTCCNMVYELNPDVGRDIAAGRDVEIMPSDLTPVFSTNNIVDYRSRYKECRNCGYGTNEDFEFCPKCGTRF